MFPFFWDKGPRCKDLSNTSKLRAPKPKSPCSNKYVTVQKKKVTELIKLRNYIQCALGKRINSIFVRKHRIQMSTRYRINLTLLYLQFILLKEDRFKTFNSSSRTPSIQYNDISFFTLESPQTSLYQSNFSQQKNNTNGIPNNYHTVLSLTV